MSQVGLNLIAEWGWVGFGYVDWEVMSGGSS